MKRLLTILFAALIFASCEDSMFLKSEKKMKEDLQGTWQREFLGDTSVHHDEFWIFTGSDLYTTLKEFDPPDQVDNGAPDGNLNDNVDTVVISGFKIDARVFRAYLKLQPRMERDSAFVDRWEFVKLEDDILHIAADNPIGPGVVQRELYKIK
jgi:hypothetical protein